MKDNFKWIVLAVAVVAIATYFVNNRYFITNEGCRTGAGFYASEDINGTFVLDRWTGEVECKR